jgi:hypothetical protein
METFFLMSIFIITLVVGVTVGWVASVNYIAYLEHNRHDYEDLFQKNPHPEIFEDDGEIYRGMYMNINFEPGYDPEQFDPEDVQLDEE